MEKANAKKRDIKFFSRKNQTVVCVHGLLAQAYSKYLEGLSLIDRYEVNLPLELARFHHLCKNDIRSDYFSHDWVSDFGCFSRIAALRSEKSSKLKT